MKALDKALALLLLGAVVSCSPKATDLAEKAAEKRVEFYHYSKLEDTSRQLPEIEQWCLKNNYPLMLIQVEISKGAGRAQRMNLKRFPSLIVFDVTGGEANRNIGQLEIRDWLEEQK